MKSFFLQSTTLLGFLVGWQILIKTAAISPLVLPGPLDVLHAVLHHHRELINETAVTAYEAILGFLGSAIIAYMIAIIFVHVRLLEQAMMPYAIGLKSIPLIALAPLIVMWCGEGVFSKIVMSALVSFWPILVGAVQGLRAIKPDALALMSSLGADKWQVLTKLRVPSSTGYTFAALKIASSLSVVGAVIAELVGSTRGIGHLINVNSYYLHTDLVFAGVAFISAVALALYGGLSVLEGKFRFWHERSID
jgi:NitT/TauT family transport system permease protein